MKKLLMNENNYLNKVIKNAEKNEEKIYSYDFNRIINLIVKREMVDYELTESDKIEIEKKTERGFKHHMNYEKTDKDKEFPKRTKDEIRNKKTIEYASEKCLKDTYRNVINIMNKISYKFIESQWKSCIVKSINNQFMNKKELKEIDKIYFSKIDLDILNTYITNKNNEVLTLTNEEKRLMFTYMIISKYYNQNNPTSVNISISVNDMFKFANMGSMKQEFKTTMINRLQDFGLLKIDFYYRKQKRDISYKVLQCDGSDKENDNIFYISSKSNEEELLMDIGKKYKDMIKMLNNDKLKQCEVCGCLIEKVNNKVKYCNCCYDEKHKEHDRVYQENKRNLK